MKWGGGALAIVMITLLASCTTIPPARSESPTPTPSPFAPTPEPTAVPLVSPLQPPTPSPSPVIVTAGERPCSASQLQLADSPGLGGGAAGSFVVALGIWNLGNRPCTLRGWATVQLLNASGGLVPTHWLKVMSDFSGGAILRTISLAPCACAGGCAPASTPAAYVSIAGNDVLEPCVTAASIRVAIPGSSTPVVVAFRVDGLQESQVFCSDGGVYLLPILSPFSALGPPGPYPALP
jgi:Protein of unknown function (DUF4232)